MFGAIYTGLSGLNAYSQGLQTVSNNVSNLNTSGFKASSVRFNDQFHNFNGGVSLSSESSGGGGVSMSDVQINFGQGDLRQTGNGLDLAIDGSGFLVLLDGDRTFYTRTGSFQVGDDGFITLQGTDYRLGVLNGSGRAVALNIDTNRTNAPVATTVIKFADNLSSTATQATVSELRVYDISGTEQVWQIAFVKDADAIDQWDVTVTNAEGREIGTTVLKFSNGLVDPETEVLTIEDSEVAGLSVTLDFSENVTSFSSGEVSTLRAASVDGHGVGTVTNITVNDRGQVELSYSNEESEELGAVAIADFRDPQSLTVLGEGLYSFNGNGMKRLLSSEDPEAGRVLAGRLEASNVDLSEQFGQLILIQRGFQASSQIISVSNDMIQQLFGIRGQG